MTRRARQTHGPAVKAKVILAALKGEKTFAELAQHYDVHPNQTTAWKAQLAERVPPGYSAPVLWGTQGRRRWSARQDRRTDAGERFFVWCAQQSRPAERKAMIDRGRGLLLARQATLLTLSRSSLYYEPRAVPAADPSRSMRRIDALYLEYPFAGNRMLRDPLRGEGVVIGRERVATMMRRMWGSRRVLYRRPNTSKPAPGHKI